MKNDLLLEYKDRIKKQVNVWFENIKNQKIEIQKASDDTLVTSNPEDMFNIIHAQLEVAREKVIITYIFLCMYECMYIYLYVCLYVCMYMCKYECKYVSM